MWVTLMYKWVLGENRYASVTNIISGTPTSGLYTIYDVSDESIVTSGTASIQLQTISCLWEPNDVGIYVVDFSYHIGAETYNLRQTIEVKETI